MNFSKSHEPPPPLCALYKKFTYNDKGRLKIKGLKKIHLQEHELKCHSHLLFLGKCLPFKNLDTIYEVNSPVYLNEILNVLL
jgi:hypothetical protein